MIKVRVLMSSSCKFGASLEAALKNEPSPEYWPEITAASRVVTFDSFRG